AMTLSDRVVVMHQGVIEQIGPPMEVYRRPRTRFVADFIGRANFVEGRVAGRDPGVLHVNALGTNFHLTNVPELPAVDAPVTMIVRPEMIRVRKAGGHLRGIVRRTAYLGDRIDYDVAVCCGDVEVNGQVLMAVETDPSHLELHPEGSTVELSFSEDCIHILPKMPGSTV
ncbi:MAG: TOBE domain-containing protein, partial [Anaerolineae bacterium]|nr:TOBE domain-containing protein [Anaerolineae bacterium]